MEYITETMMASIEANTGHPMRYWLDLVHKNKNYQYEEMVEFLIEEYGVSPVLADFFVERAKSEE